MNRLFEHYAYALNNPLAFSDPRGEITIIVHGTYAKDTYWWRPFSGFSSYLDLVVNDVWKVTSADGTPVSEIVTLAKYGPDGTFSWSGGNSPEAREEGAKLLADYIGAIRELYPDEPVRVVAHSHGGNIAKRASAKGAKIDSLVLIATPHFENEDKEESDPSRYLYSAYPPNIKGRILNIYSSDDPIQNWAHKKSGERGNIKSYSIDKNPKIRDRYENVHIFAQGMTATNVEVHSLLHCNLMGTLIGHWITEGKAKFPSHIFTYLGKGE